jgi:nitrite reductase (NAD(P)H)
MNPVVHFSFVVTNLIARCPLHKRTYSLNGEEAGKCGNDDEVNVATFAIEERDDGWVYVKLPSVEELDSVLGSSKFKVKQGETAGPFEKMDAKLKAMKGRKGFQASHFKEGKGEVAAAQQILAGNGLTSSIDW